MEQQLSVGDPKKREFVERNDRLQGSPSPSAVSVPIPGAGFCIKTNSDSTTSDIVARNSLTGCKYQLNKQTHETEITKIQKAKNCEAKNKKLALFLQNRMEDAVISFKDDDDCTGLGSDQMHY